MIRTTRADRRRSVLTYGHWVYGLYLKGSLIYVGITSDPANRLSDHKDRKVFDEMRLIKGFSCRARAEEFEKYSILALDPTLNIMKLRTNYLPSGIAAKDFDRFLAEREYEFNFTRLTNPSIKKRLARQASRRLTETGEQSAP